MAGRVRDLLLAEKGGAFGGEILGGAVVLFVGLMLPLGLLVAHPSGVRRRARRPIPEVPAGNPAIERKVAVALGLLILSCLLQTGSGSSSSADRRTR